MHMASQGHAAPVYHEEDLDDIVLDEEEDEGGGGRAADHDSSDSDTNWTTSPPTTCTSTPAIPAVPVSSFPAPAGTAVNVAILPPSSSSYGTYSNDPSPPSTSIRNQVTAITALAAVTTERRQNDDPRRLFQRLWTDEDEIELLQGFFEYTSQRGPHLPGHHHDTAAFYDQIKSKLQLDCNKNQLVEKLRRLKKKYRTVVGRIRSGKDFVFKSPHDQATFEISTKIWSSSINRPEFEDEDQNPNSNSSTPISINLNSAVGDHRNLTTSPYSIDINSLDKAAVVMNMGMPSGSRKRTRVKTEDKDSVKSVSFGGYDATGAAPVAVASTATTTAAGFNSVPNSVEETVKSYLPSMVKELIDNAIDQSGFLKGGKGGSGMKDITSITSYAVPMNFSMMSGGRIGEAMDERWKKQKILELEVYSKRLELVQDQIKSMLEELRSKGN